MNAAKVQFSEEELQLVQNASWVLTKNKIIHKVYEVFGDLAEQIKISTKPTGLPLELFAASPKISRGENYQGLPYVMLDFPRYFTKEDIFALRTFFWWGNYFSVTLHLKGKYQQMFVPQLYTNRVFLGENNFRFNVSDDEWSHEFSPVDISTSEQSTLTEWLNRPFFKCAAKVDFEEWNEASTEPMENLIEALLQSLGS